MTYGKSGHIYIHTPCVTVILNITITSAGNKGPLLCHNIIYFELVGLIIQSQSSNNNSNKNNKSVI